MASHCYAMTLNLYVHTYCGIGIYITMAFTFRKSLPYEIKIVYNRKGTNFKSTVPSHGQAWGYFMLELLPVTSIHSFYPDTAFSGKVLRNLFEPDQTFFSKSMLRILVHTKTIANSGKVREFTCQKPEKNSLRQWTVNLPRQMNWQRCCKLEHRRKKTFVKIKRNPMYNKSVILCSTTSKTSCT